MAIWIILIAMGGAFPKDAGQHGCNPSERRLPNYFYCKAVLDRALKPPGHGLVTISVGAHDWERKLVVREYDGAYEFMLGTTRQGLYRYLEEVDESCKLPVEPELEGDEVGASWQTAQLSRADFDRLHSEFLAMLNKYAAGIQSRYEPLLKSRQELSFFNSALYIVTYDNGFEKLEIAVEEGAGGPGLEWVQRMLKLGEDRFHVKL